MGNEPSRHGPAPTLSPHKANALTGPTEMSERDFGINAYSYHGCPRSFTCVAYNHVEGVLALGTTEPRIHIIYGANAQSVIDVQTPSVLIRHLIFAGELFLVCVLSDASVLVCDWVQAQILHSLPGGWLDTDVTSVQSLGTTSHPYVYLGTSEGSVHVVQILSGGQSCKLSAYAVTHEDLGIAQPPGEVVYVGINHKDNSEMVVVHEVGIATLWDIPRRRVKYSHVFELPGEPRVTAAEFHFGGKYLYIGFQDGSLMAVRKERPLKRVIWSSRSEGTTGEDLGETLPILSLQWCPVNDRINNFGMLAVRLGSSTQDLSEISRASVVFLVPRVEATTEKIDFVGVEYIPVLSIPPHIDGEHSWCSVIVSSIPSAGGSYGSPSAENRYYLLLSTRKGDNLSRSSHQEVQYIPLPQRPFNDWPLEVGAVASPLALADIQMNSFAPISSFKQFSANISSRFVKLLAQNHLNVAATARFGSEFILTGAAGEVFLRGLGEVQDGAIGLLKHVVGTEMPLTGEIDVALLGGSDSSLSVWLSAAPYTCEDGPPFMSGSSFCQFCGFIELPNDDPEDSGDNPVVHLDFAATDDATFLILCVWATNFAKIYEYPWQGSGDASVHSSGDVSLPVLIQWSLVDNFTASLIIPAYNRVYVGDKSGELSIVKWTVNETVEVAQIGIGLESTLKSTFVTTMCCAPCWNKHVGVCIPGLYAILADGSVAVLHALTGESIWCIGSDNLLIMHTIAAQSEGQSAKYCRVLDASGTMLDRMSLAEIESNLRQSQSHSETRAETETDVSGVTVESSQPAILPVGPPAKAKWPFSLKTSPPIAAPTSKPTLQSMVGQKSVEDSAPVPPAGPNLLIVAWGYNVIIMELQALEIASANVQPGRPPSTLGAQAMTVSTAPLATVADFALVPSGYAGRPVSCLACLDSDGCLTLLDIKHKMIVTKLECGRLIGGMCSAHIGSNGTVHACVGPSAFARLSFLPEGALIGAAPVLKGSYIVKEALTVLPVTPVIQEKKPAKRGSALKNILKKTLAHGPVDFEKLYGEVKDVEMIAAEKQRQRLIAGAVKLPEQTTQSQALRGASGAKSAMSEALESMQEREERLNRAAEKSAALKESAALFRDNARKIKEQNERRAKGIF